MIYRIALDLWPVPIRLHQGYRAWHIVDWGPGLSGTALSSRIEFKIPHANTSLYVLTNSFSPIPRPERILLVLSLWSARSALRADALELFPCRSTEFCRAPFGRTGKGAHRANTALASGFHWHRLGPFDSVAAGVPLRLSIEKSPKFHHCLAIGCRLSLSTSASVRCDIPIRAASFPPLKPALVLPRVSKRLTMGRSAEGEIKHACRLVSLRSEAAGVSSLG